MMETRLMGRTARMLLGLSMVAALLLGTAAPVAAHAHFAENGQAGDGQVLADGQNHPRFLPNGDGTYSFTLRAGTTTGVDRFVISAQDDAVKATLVPFLSVMSIEPAPLVVGTDELSASAGGALSFLVHEPALPAAEFSLVARLLPESARTARWPLSVDPILPIKRSPFFPSAPGLLDARGRCETELQVPPKLWNALAGRRIDWTGSIYRGFTHRTTNTVTVDVLP